MKPTTTTKSPRARTAALPPVGAGAVLSTALSAGMSPAPGSNGALSARLKAPGASRRKYTRRAAAAPAPVSVYLVYKASGEGLEVVLATVSADLALARVTADPSLRVVKAST
jgi:hypothetical protein